MPGKRSLNKLKSQHSWRGGAFRLQLLINLLMDTGIRMLMGIRRGVGSRSPYNNKDVAITDSEM